MNNPLPWLALSRIPNICTFPLRQWLTQHPIETLFSTSPDELFSHGFQPAHLEQFTQLNWQRAEQDWQWCQDHHCQLISINDSHYPILLSEITRPPLLLFAQGDLSLLNQPQLAMVGTRNPSPLGIELATQFSHSLSKAGLTITSGLARGIDAASHRAALAAEGKTIAVMGTGLQQIYPPAHQKLANEIKAKGVLLSEFPIDAPPKAMHFPMRNRIISGLSLGVLVVEAAERSGSLITARMALEQNREVFAMPGSIHNPVARGCHSLIRQGAKLVETAHDVLEELGRLNAFLSEKNQEHTKQKTLDLPPADKQILKLIGYEVTPFNVIMGRSGLTTIELSSILLSLELAGYLLCVTGGYLRTR